MRRASPTVPETVDTGTSDDAALGLEVTHRRRGVLDSHCHRDQGLEHSSRGDERRLDGDDDKSGKATHGREAGAPRRRDDCLPFSASLRVLGKVL